MKEKEKKKKRKTFPSTAKEQHKRQNERTKEPNEEKEILANHERLDLDLSKMEELHSSVF